MHDEIDIPSGELRVKQGGGHGGHNGLRDIVASLGSSDFSRIRIGVGRPRDKNRFKDFVLKAPGKDEQHLIEDTIDQALSNLPELVDGQFAEAMNALHRRTRRSTVDEQSIDC